MEKILAHSLLLSLVATWRRGSRIIRGETSDLKPEGALCLQALELLHPKLRAPCRKRGKRGVLQRRDWAAFLNHLSEHHK